jgi:hypothetical protein
MPFDAPWRNYEPGDLIYGVKGARERLIEHLKRNGYELLRWNMIDQYSVSTKRDNSSGMLFDPNFLMTLVMHDKYDSVLNQPMDWSKTRAIPGYDVNTLRQHGAAPAVDALADAKRKCKGGLDYITRYTIYHIHFCLDEIVMSSVAAKNYSSHRGADLPTGKSNRPYKDKVRSTTGAELRWVYRNRQDPRVQGKIQFWRQSQDGTCYQCPPPWEDTAHNADILAWQNYHPAHEWP